MNCNYEIVGKPGAKRHKSRRIKSVVAGRAKHERQTRRAMAKSKQIRGAYETWGSGYDYSDTDD